MTIPAFLQQAQQQIQQDLAMALQHFDLPQPLKDAVDYVVMLGGKRIRPALVYATAQFTGQNLSAAARRAAVAIEFIHCYSLTHDDLPCMDDDNLRRGKPTCHVVYDEATALLAGDILQSMAMEVLASDLFEQQLSCSTEIKLKQIQYLATASSKMVCGQVIDLQSEGKQISQAELEYLHRHKTGALIQAAIMMGAVTHLPTADEAWGYLRQYGQALGLAFQVQDDILDIIADSQTLGKTAGKDVQAKKSTYPALLGLEQAKQYAAQLHQQALDAVKNLAGQRDDLQVLTEFLLQRSY